MTAKALILSAASMLQSLADDKVVRSEDELSKDAFKFWNVLVSATLFRIDIMCMPLFLLGRWFGKKKLQENSAWRFKELLRCWEDAKNPEYYVDALKADGCVLILSLFLIKKLLHL